MIAGDQHDSQPAREGEAASALRGELTDVRRRLLDLMREHDVLERRYRELHVWAETLQGAHEDRARRVEQLEAELHGIYNSTGWRVLKVLYRVRFLLFPRGSRRERLARMLMRWQRKVRGSRRALPDAQPRGEAEALRGAPPTEAFIDGVPGLVSVVLPVFNQAGLLREAVESVLAQTHRELELIVVDDGSTDDVPAALAPLRADPRLRVLVQANQRLPKALSNGFSLARGEFWTWTSADNLMEPRQIERQVGFLRAHPNAAMVYCDYLAIGDDGKPLRDPTFRPHNRRSPNDPAIHLPRDVRTLNTVQDNFIGPCFLYRGWVGRLLGEYAPNMGVEDYDYWMRMNERFEIRHLGDDELLYRYRVHDNTLSARAGEHRIHQRVQRLMEYARERHEFHRRPWTIVADEAAAAAAGLASRHADPRVRILPSRDSRAPTPDAGADKSDVNVAAAEKLLWLVHPRTLAEDAAPPPTNACVLAWIGDDVAAPFRHRVELARGARACLAASRPALERAVLHAPLPALGAPPGPELLATATAFADDRVFYERTTPATARRRVLPRVLRRAAAPLRVLLVAEHFQQGGLEQVMLDLAAALERGRFEPLLLVLGRRGPALERAERVGFEIVKWPAGSRDAAAFAHLLRERRIDFVNAHYCTFGAAQAAQAGIPFVQTIHNAYVWFGPREIEAMRAADAHTAAYLAVSSAAAHYADARIGLPVEKMIVAPNGIDLARMDAARVRADRSAERAALGFRPDDFVYLNCASILPAKAQAPLVRAVAAARRENPRIRLAILGRVMDDACAQRLQAEIDALRLHEAVVLLGYHDEPDRFYFAADAFVLPSYWEGWSLALAEALFAGLPVVAADVGAARDVIARTGGRLVRPPVDCVTELHGGNLGEFLERIDRRFVDDLAAALVATASRPEPPRLDSAVRRSFDRATAYAAHERVFEWIATGGLPAAARAWVWEMHADDDARAGQAGAPRGG